MGDIAQTEPSEIIKVPNTSVAEAISVKVEEWDLPLELRALVQVTPKNALLVVASVGGLKQAEERILTPAIRSVLRKMSWAARHTGPDRELVLSYHHLRWYDLTKECRMGPQMHAASVRHAANNERVNGHFFGDWLVSLATSMMSEWSPRLKMIGVGATFDNSAIVSVWGPISELASTLGEATENE